MAQAAAASTVRRRRPDGDRRRAGAQAARAGALGAAATTPTSSSSTAPAPTTSSRTARRSGRARHDAGPRRARAARATPPATPTCEELTWERDGARRRAPRRRSRRRAVAARPSTFARRRRCRASTRSRVPSLETPAPTSSSCSRAPTRRRAPTTRASCKRRGVVRRGAARDPGRHHRRQAGARSPAADALRRARDRRGRTASGRRRLGRRRRPLRHGVLRRAIAPEAHGREAARAGDRACSTPSRRPPARWRSCSAPGDRGILLHEAVGHGLEADFNRKRTSNYTDQIGKRVARELCTVVDDGTHRATRAARSTSTTRATRPQRNVLIENGMLRRLHAGPALGRSTSSIDAVGQRAARRASATSRCRA